MVLTKQILYLSKKTNSQLFDIFFCLYGAVQYYFYAFLM